MVPKQIIIAAAMFFLTFVINGQEVMVTESRIITSLADGEFMPVAVSSDSRCLLLTRPGYNELHLYDLGSGRKKLISSARGAGYEPAFASSCDMIYYREDEYRELRKYSALFEYDLNSGKSSLIEPFSRTLTSPTAEKDMVYYSADGSLRSRPAGRKSGQYSGPAVRLALEELTPVLYTNESRREIRPNGQGIYIWASLSPDRTRILYNFNGICTYICDTEGNIISVPGRINAPEWLGNRFVIGMNDRDDGHRIISSDIVCYSVATGKTISLTDTEDRLELYPVPFPDGRRIAYQSGEGVVCIISVMIK